MLLAFDTSTSLASVALVAEESATTDADARLLAEYTWQVGQRHSVELLERIQALLAETHATMADLTGIAVALGPGSFNGVRVALATAKSLAFALSIPLYGIPTLDMIAWGHCMAGETICAILEAGRGQVYAAIYDTGDASAAAWSPRAGYAIVTSTELAEQLSGDIFCCGEMSAETRSALAETLGSRYRSGSALDVRRASWLAELALARAAQQRYDDPMALEPLYLRRPAITSRTKRGVSLSAQGNHIQQTQQTRQRSGAPEGEGTADALRRE